jgi:NACalpha-BTF3-like transcription factor
MNRKQRRAFAKQKRVNKKKVRTVERKLGTDYESVQGMAVVMERVKDRMTTIQQAIEQIPADELDSAKLIKDLLHSQQELKTVRTASEKMGPAVQQAVNDAIEQLTQASSGLEGALGGINETDE